MATPILVKPLVDLRDALNARFPNRDKASDGWIGDRAHQQQISGHNPDDTIGVRAEGSDSDSIPEVRGFDVDTDFRDVETDIHRKVYAADVVSIILADPEARKILRYIIYSRRIWRKANGWRGETYTGASPHVEHIHFSSDDDYDNVRYNWSSVRNIGRKESDVSPEQDQILKELLTRVKYIDGRTDAMQHGDTVVTDDRGSFPNAGDPMALVATLNNINERLTAIEERLTVES